MNWTLIRKDFRLLRPVFISVAAMAVLFYAGFAISGYRDELRYIGNTSNDRKMGIGGVVFGIQNASVFVMFAMSLWAAMAGGMAFAYERRERWSEFVGLMPVSRSRLIGQKLAACLLACVVMFGANAVVALLGGWLPAQADSQYLPWYRSSTWPPVSVNAFFSAAGKAGGLAMAMFGIAWLLSTILRSAVMAACIAIGVSSATVLIFSQLAHPALGDKPIMSSETAIALGRFGLWTVGAIAIAVGVVCERWRTDL